MTISVIILTAGTSDRLTYIDALLKSIAKQTVKPDEVIIATETSGAKLRQLLSEHLGGGPHRVIETGYWHKGKTANKAIAEAKGDIIFLLEDDLVLRRNFVEEVVKTFDEHKDAGCVYTNCIWVHQEGLKKRGGLAGLAARLLSKLTVHEALFPRQVKYLGDGLYEVPVFTMSVACKKEVLVRAGLYDEALEEPIQGEDFDLALRIRASGFKIIMNPRAVSYHFTRQATKRAIKLARDPSHLEGIYRSEIYYLTKNINMVGPYLIPHIIYRTIEATTWALRTRKPKVLIYGVKGVIEGVMYGTEARRTNIWHWRKSH
ncbi:glycosyltransferase family 2 protein [Thermoproteus tenax]|uniref:Glycosyltransferase (Type2) n=1 Tax=Thermoproteus tenax (strain ATCC 35583 / DSM 2078 / JCM 9277 / NBRC 100435 / Kra 1) TaxID=768679 RepID=G4RK97_THETK|nr:glycosyltransferase [Thermoproteus tenax]CCC81992.1 glycosyltransferase (type2) [Thermoproteus tenax Kra 1]